MGRNSIAKYARPLTTPGLVLASDISGPDLSNTLNISLAMAANNASKSTYGDQVTTEKRVRRMRMSGYFRRPRDSALNSSLYPSTAETLQHYQELNADLDEFTQNPVIKLRMSSKKKPQRLDSAKVKLRKYPVVSGEPSDRKVKKERGSARKKSYTTKSMKEKQLQEIELVAGMGIFHDDEDDLKHEMIDTAKAKQIVTALKYVKKQIAKGEVPEEELLSQSNLEAARKDAISVIEGGKLTVNLATIQQSFEQELMRKNSTDELKESQENLGRGEGDSSMSRAKITDQ